MEQDKRRDDPIGLLAFSVDAPYRVGDGRAGVGTPILRVGAAIAVVGSVL